jgi:hypothetical protein
LHAVGNTVGALLLAALGWRARLGPRDLLALGIAWPLTHALLALKPDLPAYFGASGLLHAAAAIVGLGLLRQGGRARVIGLALLAGLLLKLGLEHPWGPALQPAPAWGSFPIAPWGHAMGVLAGALSAVSVRPRAAPAPQ